MMNPQQTKDTPPSDFTRKLDMIEDIMFKMLVSLFMTLILTLIASLRHGDFSLINFVADWLTGWVIATPALFIVVPLAQSVVKSLRR